MPTVLKQLKSLIRPLGWEELPFPDTLNIETSYACNLKCVMCPRHFDGVPQKMFSMDLFRQRVEPVLSRFRYVHLTGWGEPLMSRHLVDMLESCKKAGLWTCFTTNGLLLKDPLSRRVLETRLELVNVSCDAACAETYEYVRGKGTFDVLMNRLDEFTALRREMGSETLLSWTYVMLKPNLAELPAAIRLAARKGAGKFVAKHLETAITRQDLELALFDTGIAGPIDKEWDDRYRGTIAEATRAAQESGIILEVHPRRMAHADNQCLMKPVTNIFVDFEGRVSPCCYLNMNDVMPYISRSDLRAGIIGELPLNKFIDILDSPAYEEFRRSWQRGEPPPACTGCLQLNRMKARD